MLINAKIAIYACGNYHTSSAGIVRELFAQFLGCSHAEADYRFSSYSRTRLSIDSLEETTADDVKRLFAERAGFHECLDLYLRTAEVALLYDRNLAIIEDGMLTLEKALAFLGKPPVFDAFILFRGDAGEVFRGVDKGITYRFHSRESGHNVAHVHVDVRHEYSASIGICTGEVLAGSLPKKDLKTVRERIKENELYLLEQWNKQTDGVRVDLNYGMGLCTIC